MVKQGGRGLVYFVGMNGRIKWIVLSLLFMAVVVIGGWLRVEEMRRPLPTGDEAAHLFAVAGCLEPVVSQEWTGVPVERVSVFHWAVARCADFMSTESAQTGMQMRAYRLLPVIVSILVLGLVPLLGVRRSGGVFDSEGDALLATGLMAVAPMVVFEAMMLGPFSFHILLFVALLVLFRTYARWPGFGPAVAIGALATLAIALDVNVVWTMVVLIPTVMVGVGWSRLCLYWSTWHVVTLLLVLGAGVGALVFYGMLEVPALPMLPSGRAWLNPLWWSLGGLGCFAWVALAILSGFRAERRWMRLFVILFPACFVGAFFFPQGGSFAVALACLTPLMVALALGGIVTPWRRWTIGGITVVVLLGVSLRMISLAQATWGTRGEQRASIRCLRDAMANVAEGRQYQVRVVTDDAADALAALAPLRLSKARVVVSPEAIFDDADMVMVSERRLEEVPSAVGRKICPGAVAIGKHRFRVFTEKVK